MARKNQLKIAKDKKGNTVKNIYTLVNASGKTEYFTSFMLNGVSYQKKNLTKNINYNATTIKQATEALESAKVDLRNGKNPFIENVKGDKVRDIILKQIKAKKPLVEGKDNSHYKRSLELFYNNYIDSPFQS